MPVGAITRGPIVATGHSVLPAGLMASTGTAIGGTAAAAAVKLQLLEVGQLDVHLAATATFDTQSILAEVGPVADAEVWTIDNALVHPAVEGWCTANNLALFLMAAPADWRSSQQVYLAAVGAGFGDGFTSLVFGRAWELLAGQVLLVVTATSTETPDPLPAPPTLQGPHLVVPFHRHQLVIA